MTADEICVHLRELSQEDLFDVITSALHRLQGATHSNEHRLRDLSRVLRSNGIDPNSPDAVRDLDRRLRGKE